jgi:hypothetical protein
MPPSGPSISIRFRTRLTSEQYGSAVLACQFALIVLGLSESATVWPDGTATDAQINALSDRWLATSPWSD